MKQTDRPVKVNIIRSQKDCFQKRVKILKIASIFFALFCFLIFFMVCILVDLSVSNTLFLFSLLFALWGVSYNNIPKSPDCNNEICIHLIEEYQLSEDIAKEITTQAIHYVHQVTLVTLKDFSKREQGWYQYLKLNDGTIIDTKTGHIVEGTINKDYFTQTSKKREQYVFYTELMDAINMEKDRLEKLEEERKKRAEWVGANDYFNI